MPRGRPKVGTKPLPLAPANDRLLMLEKAGMTKDRLAGVLAKVVTVVETILDDPDADPFARIAAAKMLARDIVAIAPYKVSGPQPTSQAPVIINIGDAPPEPSRKPRAVSVAQAGEIIDVEPNAP